MATNICRLNTIQYIQAHEDHGLGISAISCWEVAKLVERGRLVLPIPIAEWFDQAFEYAGMSLLELTPKFASNRRSYQDRSIVTPPTNLLWPPHASMVVR